MHHVGDLSFGRGYNPYMRGTPFRDLIMNVSTKDEWTLHLAMLETYDQTMGIFDHDNLGDSDPLAIIGMHPAEDTVSYSRLDILMRELMAYRIPELTNTPLKDLLEYPRWMLDRLLRDGRKASKKDDENERDLAKIEEQAKKPIS